MKQNYLEIVFTVEMNVYGFSFLSISLGQQMHQNMDQSLYCPVHWLLFWSAVSRRCSICCSPFPCYASDWQFSWPTVLFKSVIGVTLLRAHVSAMKSRRWGGRWIDDYNRSLLLYHTRYQGACVCVRLLVNRGVAWKKNKTNSKE